MYALCSWYSFVGSIPLCLPKKKLLGRVPSVIKDSAVDGGMDIQLFFINSVGEEFSG